MTWVNFQTVRENLDVLAVLKHYKFEIRKNGHNQVKICCPFHDDKNPSCGFNTKKSVFNCFSCGAKGNVLDFLARMEGFDPSNPRQLRDAAIAAVDTFGIDGGSKPAEPSQEPKAKKRSEPSQRGRKRRPAATMQKEDQSPCPPSNPAPHEVADTKDEVRFNPPLTFALKLDASHPFLRDRKIKKKLVKLFGLGFAKRGSMNGRVCFPIHNEIGELIGYAGRWADKKIPKDTPRYLLPKGFEKSRVLFNLNRVLERRAECSADGADIDDAVVIVEGFWSVLRLHADGVPVVASFGDTLSPEQVGLLVQAGFNRAVLIFDGDEGGRKGTEQALPVLAPRLFAKTLMLEDGEKPDTMSDKLVADLPRYVR